MNPAATLSQREYDAVLFDLDGVLTRTARVHAAAWKALFDEFLERRAAETGEPFVPFDIDSDYPRYVDGKPRYEGMADFLASRGIELPMGNPDDGPDVESRYGLGSLKDRHFLEQLETQGVERFEPAIRLVRELRTHQIRTAVVSSSTNCEKVLEAAGIARLFDARVDGVEIARHGLRGKPAPDSFLEAARRLGCAPGRTAVVEDAIAGVEAGRAGDFALVIGVDRGGQEEALRAAGADVVVTDLGQVRIAPDPAAAWSLVFHAFDPADEGVREALCTLGNGYFGTRGADGSAVADGVHYPGTYLAGGYNRLRTAIAGRVVENEDLVNLPNWLTLKFRVDEDDWFDLGQVEILSYRQELDMRRGVLSRRVHFQDRQGRRSTLVARRFVSMSDMHLGAQQLSLTAEDWSGRVTVHAALDGRVVNAGAKLYRKFENEHLEPLESSVIGPDEIFLLACTTQSKLRVAQAARTQCFIDGNRIDPERTAIEEPRYVAQEFAVELAQGKALVLEKLVSLHSSRDPAISEAGLEARKAIRRARNFELEMDSHTHAWKHLWHQFDVRVDPAAREVPDGAAEAAAGRAVDVPMLLRLHMFHLLQAVSPNSIGLDIGVPARGWTGEAYQGHVFWDELFIFPFFNYRMPEITRSLLMYRYRRLDEARAAAAAAGYEGAMFPWQSGSDGQEETQEMNLNPHSQRWVPDHTYLQRHVGSAIAYNVWQYFQVTHDLEFMNFYGAELILDIAKFWSSIAMFHDERQRYEIHGVMGPDEFHDGYPGSPHPGINNNAYTNIMAVWVLLRAQEVLGLLSEVHREELTRRLGIKEEEIARWSDISHRMYVPFHEDGAIISQFEGYGELAELDWDAYRARYGNIQRLELLLEAEGDSANNYKVSKQADVLMLFYLFSAEELHELFERLDYPFEYETIPRNIDYYAVRGSHGSTLSRVVYAWVLARSDRPRAMRFFEEALLSDVDDIQEGTTAEGVHLGAMAGTVDLVQRVSTGLEVRSDILRLTPQLPREMERLDMRIRYRGHSLDLCLTSDTLSICGRDGSAPPIKVCVDGEISELDVDTTLVFAVQHRES